MFYLVCTAKGLKLNLQKKALFSQTDFFVDKKKGKFEKTKPI